MAPAYSIDEQTQILIRGVFGRLAAASSVVHCSEKLVPLYCRTSCMILRVQCRYVSSSGERNSAITGTGWKLMATWFDSSSPTHHPISQARALDEETNEVSRWLLHSAGQICATMAGRRLLNL